MSVAVTKTPGVYIYELDAFGNAVVPVATAIPAFIGYTGQTLYNGKNLVNKAVKIASLAEFNAIFGKTPPQIQFSITALTAKEGAPSQAAPEPDKEQGAPNTQADSAKVPGATDKKVSPPTADFSIGGSGYSLNISTVQYRLYNAVQFFYGNGGGTCYIISTGEYDYSATGLTDTTPFTQALKVLEKEMEPTMIVIPDAVELMDATQTELANKYALCYSLQGETINHCGSMANRVVLLDIPGGYSEPLVGETSVKGFRDNVKPTLSKYNSYAAAYYPWLYTTVNQLGDIGYKNIATASQPVVTAMLEAEFPAPAEANAGDNPMKKYITALFAEKPGGDGITQDKADAVLKNLSASYRMLLGQMLDKLNLMPPSAAMAGIYTVVDDNEGVWEAPANVGLQNVIAPAIKIDYAMQEDLNVPLDGKSICAIRSFPGRGVLVWGARTLDGNSNDWRYINVRRTLIYIEQSIKEAASAYVFAPNDASTWVAVRSMISNFLLSLWNQGGLVGPKPADAFSVRVGLGSTMTPEDILNGVMVVAVKVAVSHPAEFIEITFQQEMQKG